MTSGSTTITFDHNVKSAVQAGLDALALAETWAQNGAAKESWRARIAEIRTQLRELHIQINRDTGAGTGRSL